MGEKWVEILIWAAKLKDNVPDSVKNDRLNRLLKHQLKIAEKRYASRICKTLEILVEGEAKNQNLAQPGTVARVWTGRSGRELSQSFAAKSHGPVCEYENYGIDIALAVR